MSTDSGPGNDDSPGAVLFDLPHASRPGPTPAAATVPLPRPAPEADTPPSATPGVWRLSKRGVVAFPDYSPGTCSGDHGLCGVCVGARCENTPEPEHDETEHDDEEPEP